jgi:hypothetical protein
VQPILRNYFVIFLGNLMKNINCIKTERERKREKGGGNRENGVRCSERHYI